MVEAPYLSQGVFKRIAIMIHAALHQADVTHVTGDINFAAILLNPRRSVLTVLDCLEADAKRGISGWVFRNVWFRWPVKRCAIVTTISEASKRDIVRITGCDPAKVVVTSVAISTSFEPTPKEFRQDFPRILQIGTSYNKNLERLCSALKGIACKVVIVGRLSDSQAAALKENAIDFEHHSRLSSEELLAQYASADIVAFASTFEGFGMPILEGNAIGRVVVTGNCTSMPEVAGDAACLVDPYDVEDIRKGFLKVIEDVEYRNQLIENGFKNIQRFDPEKIANRYRAIYEFIALGNSDNPFPGVL